MARLKAVSQESRSAGLRWEQRAVGEALHGQSVAPHRGLFGGLITGGGNHGGISRKQAIGPAAEEAATQVLLAAQCWLQKMTVKH